MSNEAPEPPIVDEVETLPPISPTVAASVVGDDAYESSAHIAAAAAGMLAISESTAALAEPTEQIAPPVNPIVPPIPINKAPEVSDAASLSGFLGAPASAMSPVPDVGAAVSILDTPEIPPVTLPMAVHQVRKQLASLHRPKECVGLESQRQQLMNSFLATLERGESNATILLGFRGSGKSLILQSCIDELRQSHQFSYVYLNGCLQKTEKLALREIVNQITIDDQKRGGQMVEVQEAFAKHITSGKRTILVLDEFDMFAQRSRQSFLYNILDSLQAPSVRLSIVGLSCRMDVLDLLEKRVRSRFSNSIITFYSALSTDQVLAIIRARLLLPPHLLDAFGQKFNEHVEAFIKDPIIRDFVYKKYEVSRDVRSFLQMMVLAVSTLSSAKPFITRDSLPHSFSTLDSKNLMVQGLSILEICLLISMKKLEEDGTDFYNFEMIYITYKKFATATSNIVELYPKNVAFKAFEHLAKLELIRLDTANHHLREFQEVSLLIEPSQIVEALMKFRDCPVAVKQWGCQ